MYNRVILMQNISQLIRRNNPDYLEGGENEN